MMMNSIEFHTMSTTSRCSQRGAPPAMSVVTTLAPYR